MKNVTGLGFLLIIAALLVFHATDMLLLTDSTTVPMNSGDSADRYRVVLLGDSTLDNVVWTGKTGSVPDLLRQKMKEVDGGGHVINLAADTFTTADVLNGAAPMVSWKARRDAGDPFPTSFARRFEPLKQLRAMNPPPTHVVISVGGNDVREILGDLRQLPETLKQLPKNLMRICEEVAKVCPNIILSVLYRPAIGQDHVYEVYNRLGMVVKLPTARRRNHDPGQRIIADEVLSKGVENVEALLHAVYKPILEAFSHKYPHGAVADFSNSFNPHDEDLYDHQIEPAAKGSSLIANLISHIVTNHNFDQQSSSSSATLYHVDVKPQDHVVVSNGDASKWKLLVSAS